MNRPITYDEFCRRCERQGKSQHQFSQLHSDPVVQQWCHMIGTEEKWLEIKDTLDQKVERAREIELLLSSGTNDNGKDSLIHELRNLYWRTFDAFKIKGIIEAIIERGNTQDALIHQVGVAR